MNLDKWVTLMNGLLHHIKRSLDLDTLDERLVFVISKPMLFTRDRTSELSTMMELFMRT